MEPEEIIMANQVINDLIEAEENAEEEEMNEHPFRFLRQLRLNPYTLPEKNFMKNYRLSKELTRQVIAMVIPYVEEAKRSSDLTIEAKVLVALNFYAQGSYQESVGKHLLCATISQPSVSRSIREVTNALNRPEIMRQFIHFPQNVRELEEIRLRFFQKYNFPGIVGIVDGTHLAIVRPNQNEEIFVNRKNYHSLNVQLVCDDNLKIMAINSRFPGSSHDSHVWRQSNVSRVMERIHRNINQPFFLLGDSGYPLRPWLLTPLNGHPAPGTREWRFQIALTSTRSLVERCNERIKNCFRCLLKHRVLHYSPEFAGIIFNACAVLNNICIENNIPEPNIHEVEHVDFGMYQADINVDAVIDPLQNVNLDLAAGRRLRNTIINTHFR